MNNNATHNTQNNKHSVSDKHSDEGQCPAWCVKHERYDIGHRDEGFMHVSRRRQCQHHTFELRQDRMLRDSRPGPVGFWLDGEEMTPAQAKKLGQLIIETAAGVVAEPESGDVARCEDCGAPVYASAPACGLCAYDALPECPEPA